MVCEAEMLSCQEWVEALNSAARAQGFRGSLTFEECSMGSFEEKWGVVGTEVGVMYQCIGDMRAQSFQNTSGLHELRLKDLDLEIGLVTTKQLFEQTDCAALLRKGDDDTPQLGTIGIKN